MCTRAILHVLLFFSQGWDDLVAKKGDKVHEWLIKTQGQFFCFELTYACLPLLCNYGPYMVHNWMHGRGKKPTYIHTACIHTYIHTYKQPTYNLFIIITRDHVFVLNGTN